MKIILFEIAISSQFYFAAYGRRFQLSSKMTEVFVLVKCSLLQLKRNKFKNCMNLTK